MEIYFKNMTTEEVPTERLVEDLMKLIYDAEDLVKAAGGHLVDQRKEQLSTALDRLKASCNRIQESATASARATERLIRRHPYPSVGIALGVGVLLGVLLKRD